MKTMLGRSGPDGRFVAVCAVAQTVLATSASAPGHEAAKATVFENAKRFVMLQQFWPRQRRRRKRALTHTRMP